MDNIKYRLTMAALIHDIGKMVYRAYSRQINHSELGVEFINPYIADHDVKKDIIRAVKNHHLKDLKTLQTVPEDISYIVYEADNLASAADRRTNEGDSSGFKKYMPLESVFNTLQSINGSEAQQQKRVFKLQGLIENDNLQYPYIAENGITSQSEYLHLLNILEQHFQQKPIDKFSINEMLQLFEAVSVYVPSSTNLGEIADISLYDHQKITAAIAACIYDYCQYYDINDYKSICYGSKQRKFRSEKSYLLASGRLQGIEDFVYTVPSKGAMRSMRGCSLYVDILIENIIDELLDSLELSRCNLIYSGGGEFQLLLPNTPKAGKGFRNWQSKVNKWLMNQFGNQLYLTIGVASISANDMRAALDEQSGMAAVYRRLRMKINQDNKNRFKFIPEQLAELFNPESKINFVSADGRECCVCHKSATALVSYDNTETIMVCPQCLSLKNLGKTAMEADVIAIYKMEEPMDDYSDKLPLPGIDAKLYMKAISLSNTELEAKNAIRLYVKNKLLIGNSAVTKLWMSDYAAKLNNCVLDFGELAKMSGGSLYSSGINRLGVMQMDIDDMQLALIAGFPEHTATFSRIAVLSRQIELFFKRYINSICQGNLAAYGEPGSRAFRIFESSKGNSRNIHVIYSGNGKLLIAGAWDDVFEFAIDLKKAFARFANDRMTFSAGIGMYNPKTPIAAIIRSTNELVKYAKQGTKNSIAMLGTVLKDSRNQEEYFVKYSWEDFIDKVCKEKLSFIEKNICVSGSSNNKIKISKGTLYKIMELLRNSSKKINLARFAYVLARMEPSNKNAMEYSSYKLVRENFYKWYKNPDDRKQLATAIELIVYKVREKGDY